MDEQQVGYFTPLVADGLEQVVGSVAETRDWIRSVEMSWQWLLPWTSDRLNDLSHGFWWACGIMDRQDPPQMP
jgi:hypothetical protein